MFLILFVLILEGYFLQNRIIFDSVDKLSPVSNMAYSCLKKMLDTIILYTLKVYQKMFFYIILLLPNLIIINIEQPMYLGRC